MLTESSGRPGRIPRTALFGVWLLAVGLSGCAPQEESAAAPEPEPTARAASPDPVEGVWRPRTYRIGGDEPAELAVDGRISFQPGPGAAAPGEWFVLFFVTDDEGAPRRGSAEGGAWFREGETLVLTHTLHLSAGDAIGPLAEAPLRMALRSAETASRDHREPTRAEVEGDALTLHFPSGNSMTFVRAAAD